MFFPKILIFPKIDFSKNFKIFPKLNNTVVFLDFPSFIIHYNTSSRIRCGRVGDHSRRPLKALSLVL